MPSQIGQQRPSLGPLQWAPKIFYCASSTSSPLTLLTGPNRVVSYVSYLSVYTEDKATDVTLELLDPSSNVVKISKINLAGADYSAQLIDHDQGLSVFPGYALRILNSTGADLNVACSGWTWGGLP